jgi:RHS repeat-associated protein
MHTLLTSAPVTLTVTGGTAASAAVYYIHTDQLNTPRVIADQNQAVVWRWESDGFGAAPPNENPGAAGAFEFNPRFAGQYFDRESNLHYNYFRDYDPQTGRYVESDPIGLAGGINTYGYVAGNPLKILILTVCKLFFMIVHLLRYIPLALLRWMHRVAMTVAMDLEGAVTQMQCDDEKVMQGYVNLNTKERKISVILRRPLEVMIAQHSRSRSTMQNNVSACINLGIKSGFLGGTTKNWRAGAIDFKT